ncbi:MAG TPA: VWA domain-containing protein [bacterium]|nr:VWA domain-containing protein [bacterium]
MSAPFPLPVVAALCVPALVPAQIERRDVREQQHLAASAIRQWVADFEVGRLGPRGGLHASPRLQPRYMQTARHGGFFEGLRLDRLNHLDTLQKLLFFAERHPSVELTDAVLDVAATRICSALFDRDAFELRELGHWTLMRCEDQATWYQILRTAAGERLPVLRDLRPEEASEQAVTEGPGRRVAALRLLGQRGLPVFRSTLEAAMVDADPRVRLAAAEAIQPPWKVALVRRIGRVLAQERHPVVSQALVRLLFRMMKRPPADMSRDERMATITGAIEQFGRCGWRTDMDLLDLVEQWPTKAAIPKLIEALDLSISSPDALVSAVNKRASPLLRERAGMLLRAMTGALVPIDDPDAWRRFWAQEQDNIVVPDRLPQQVPEGTRTTFFGVPVTGASIAFLIDTSGSMDDAPAGKGPITGPRRTRTPRTRLEAAKAQLALAVQAMPPESQFFLLTFADDARTWTRQPIRPGKRAARSVTGLLSRLHAKGGTNLYAGLVAALEVEGRSFGSDALPKIDELFVLSDGEPTAGEVQDADEMLAIVRHANKYAKVRINTVFTGAGEGSDLLRRLAEENGGVFVQR